MAEEIIIKYRAEVDQLTGEINKVIVANEKLEKSAEELSKDQTKTATQTAAAYSKTATAANKAAQAAQKTGQATTNAAKQTTKAAGEAEAAFRKTATAAQKAGTQISSTFDGVGSSIKNIGLSIASGFAAAFSVQAIVQFGKATVDAFLEAEKNANKLRFAITQINGESEQTFERLINQSERLQQITVFSDDDIQKAQTALATFGLTSTQIEELIPNILNLASANSVDLASATDTVLRGIEGEQRGLKLLGVQLEKVGTETENYNQILEQSAKFTNAASDATKTLSGQLEQTKNRYDDLQEFVGSGLAGVFTSAKNAIYEAIGALFDFDNSVTQLTKKENKVQFDALQDFIADLEKQGKSAAEIYDILTDKVNLTEKQLTETTKKRAEVRKGTDTDEFTRLTNLQRILNQRLEVIKEELDRRKEAAEFEKRQISAESLKSKSLEQLIALREKEQKVGDSASRSNIEVINRQIELLTKLTDAQKKANEKAAEELRRAKEKELALLEQSFTDAQKAQQDYIKGLEAKQKEIDELLTFQVSLVVKNQGQEAGLNLLRDQLQARYAEEAAFIEKNAQIDGESAEITAAKKLRAYEAFAAEFKRIAKELGLFQEEENQEATDNVIKYADTWIGKNEEILRSSVDLFSQLTSLSNAFTETTIQNLERQLNASNETATREQEGLEESRDKRLISEQEYRSKSDAIEAQRVQNEKKIQAEINKQRKKQAQLDKVAAVFEIALNTAIAITKAFAEAGPIAGIPLAALIAALGAAQTATVLATPIPAFKKGTKGKKGSGMALVGEEGPEITFVPNGTKILPAKQTKTYGEVFDAMQDNRFEKYIMQKYVTPALMNQKKKFEESKQASFASNIVNSMQVNGLTTGDLMYGLRKGTVINNADEIAEKLAQKLQAQRPDLWRI